MKAFLGVLGFVVFVAGLMGGAWWASKSSQPKPAVGSAQAPSAGAGDEDDKPVPLPALYVFKDNQDQKPIALAGARPKPILLHLWASWCGPCRAELPSLLAFGKSGPVDVVAVSVDDHFEDVLKFFQGKPPPEVVWDKNITLERALGVDSIPTTFLVDTNGMVRDRFDGAQPWDDPRMARAVADDLK